MSDRPPAFPTLAHILDIVGVVSLLLAVTVFFTGGFREWTPLGRISVTSWGRPLAVALILLGLRHWLVLRPTMFTRARIGLTRAWTSPGVRVAFPLMLTTCGGALLIGFLAVSLFGYRPDVRAPWRMHENEFLNLPARWDTGWYLGVAVEGYSWNPAGVTRQQNIAFFPLYPMLMRYGSLLLARNVMWTGVVISWLSYLCALVYLFRLARHKFDDEKASAGVALLACYPFAFFFSTAYTEALFLLTVVAACYHFERNELWRAAAWGLAAGLTRPNGCLLSVVLALMAVGPLWPNLRAAWRPVRPSTGWSGIADRIAVAAAPGIGMLIYSTYVYYLTGNPLQWAVQNAAWGRVYRGLDDFVAQQAQRIGEHGLYSFAATRTIDALQLAAVLFMLATVVPVFRRLGAPYAAMILVNILPPLMMGGLLSMGRVTSVLFPTFIWLGAAIPSTQRPAWLGIFAMLQAICAALFFTWRPLY